MKILWSALLHRATINSFELIKDLFNVLLCVVHSTNVERPRDLKEAFNVILAGLDDDSVCAIYTRVSRVTLASPAMGHLGTWPLDFRQFTFLVNFRAAHSLTAITLCGSLFKHNYLCSATAAAVVQSRLREPCSVYYFTSFYVRQKVSCSFVPSRTKSWL